MTDEPLRVEAVMMHDGHGWVRFHHAPTGRHLDLEIDTDDYPAAQDAWRRFCGTLTASALDMLLGMTDAAMPDGPPPVESVVGPCRICGNRTAANRQCGLSWYCPEHSRGRV